MHLSAHLSYQPTWIIRGRRHHGKHFARLGIDGYNTAYLSLKESLSKSLQVQVDAQSKVFACHRTLIELATLVTSLYSSVRITKFNFDTLLSPELFLIVFLHAEFTDIVAWLIVAVIFYIALRNFSHISEYMGSIGTGVFTYASLLHIETWETEHFFLEHTEVLIGQLSHEELLGVTRITGIFGTVLDIVHPFDEELFCNAKRVAEVHRVESSTLLVHHHHDIIRRLIVHHQFAVSVVDGST